MYPRGLLVQLRKKAQEIWKHPPSNRSNETQKVDKPSMHISIPNFRGADTIAQKLERTGIKVIITTGQKSGAILRSKHTSGKENISVVYQITCGGCHKKYIGDTGRGVKIRLTEHKRDLREHRQSNAMVLHLEESNHLPRWDGASVLQECSGKQLRRALEAVYIRLEETTNTRAGFFTLSKYTAKLALQTR